MADEKDLPDEEEAWTEGREEGLVVLLGPPLSSLVILGPASSLALLGPGSSLALLGPGSRRGLLGPASGPPGSRGGGELMAFLNEESVLTHYFRVRGQKK